MVNPKWEDTIPSFEDTTDVDIAPKFEETKDIIPKFNETKPIPVLEEALVGVKRAIDIPQGAIGKFSYPVLSDATKDPFYTEQRARDIRQELVEKAKTPIPGIEEPLTPATNALEGATGTLGEFFNIAKGQPESVIRAGQAGVADVVESIPTPMEQGVLGVAGKIATPLVRGMSKLIKKIPESPKVIPKGIELPNTQKTADLGLIFKLGKRDAYIRQKAIAKQLGMNEEQAHFSAMENLGIKSEPIPTTPPEPTSPVQKFLEKKEWTPEQKLIDALKKSKDIRSQQDAMNIKWRREQAMLGSKIPQESEADYFKRLASLKTRPEIVEFETLKGQIGQEDINALFKKIGDSDLSYHEQIAASNGLAKMFGEQGGRVPPPSELKLLNKVFGEDVTKEILKHRSSFQKFKELGLEVANVPRAIMASFDLSAPLRQGVFMIGRPKQFIPAFGEQFKAFASENAYNTVMDTIRSKPNFNLMQESGLALTDLEGAMGGREEKFAASLAEKIPYLGRGIRASGRAYTAFLNKLRADVFDDLIKNAKIAGRDPYNDPKLAKEIAEFINAATGRGKLPAQVLEQAAPLLNATFFSPRLMASRVQLLNPVYYIKADPFVRKEALKSLLAFSGFVTTTVALAKFGGADVVTDPRSADFMKIKIGNTRMDVAGGFQQYVKLASQLISGRMISTTLPGKQTVLGEGFRPLTRWDLAQRFVESKEAPIFSFVQGLMRGTTNIGEKFIISKEIGSRFVPMVIQDAYDLYKENPKLLPLSALGVFGVGMQTYTPEDMSKEPIKSLRADYLKTKDKNPILEAVRAGTISQKQAGAIVSPENETYLGRAAQKIPLKDLYDVIESAKPEDRKALAQTWMDRSISTLNRVSDKKSQLEFQKLLPLKEKVKSYL